MLLRVWERCEQRGCPFRPICYQRVALQWSMWISEIPATTASKTTGKRGSLKQSSYVCIICTRRRWIVNKLDYLPRSNCFSSAETVRASVVFPLSRSPWNQKKEEVAGSRGVRPFVKTHQQQTGRSALTFHGGMAPLRLPTNVTYKSLSTWPAGYYIQVQFPHSNSSSTMADR